MTRSVEPTSHADEQEDPYLLDRDLFDDPDAGYGRLREMAPVVRVRMHDDSTTWLVTRYAEVRSFLRDSRFVVDQNNVPGAAAPPSRLQSELAGIDEELGPYLLELITDRDPPDHTRLRRAVAREFSTARVKALRPQIEQVVERDLNALPRYAVDGIVDLLEHFARPMPVSIMCELVGIPEKDRPQWNEWIRAVQTGDSEKLVAAAHPAIAYMHDVVEQRRAEPVDDLVSVMVRGQAKEGGLTDVEIVGMVLTMVIGGQDNTAHLVANGTAALLTFPDQLARLLDDPDRIPDAIDELQRWWGTPMRTRPRYVAEKLEFGGRRLHVGDQVSAVLVSANRDPRRFTDPERFDVTRFAGVEGERQLSFGQGVHHCIGASLAREEADVAFRGLLRRYPDLSLAVPAEKLPWVPHLGVRTLERLPVRLGAG